jgi:hypothetical protein
MNKTYLSEYSLISLCAKFLDVVPVGGERCSGRRGWVERETLSGPVRDPELSGVVVMADGVEREAAIPANRKRE